MNDHNRYRVKRVFDLVLTTPVLLLISPLLALVALAVRLTSQGPVFYPQIRAGRYGRPFRTYKFRSMFVNDIHPIKMGKIDKDNPLITPVGRFIRRFKIDELPQLWNVFRGKMSLIGPRPTLLEQVESYTAEQRRRLEVLPGLTGWAQVNGNIELSWENRIRLDVWYLDNWSFWLDIKIILLTFDVIVRGEHPRWEALDAAGIRRSS